MHVRRTIPVPDLLGQRAAGSAASSDRLLEVPVAAQSLASVGGLATEAEGQPRVWVKRRKCGHRADLTHDVDVDVVSVIDHRPERRDGVGPAGRAAPDVRDLAVAVIRGEMQDGGCFVIARSYERFREACSWRGLRPFSASTFRNLADRLAAEVWPHAMEHGRRGSSVSSGRRRNHDLYTIEVPGPEGGARWRITLVLDGIKGVLLRSSVALVGDREARNSSMHRS